MADYDKLKMEYDKLMREFSEYRNAYHLNVDPDKVAKLPLVEEMCVKLEREKREQEIKQYKKISELHKEKKNLKNKVEILEGLVRVHAELVSKYTRVLELLE